MPEHVEDKLCYQLYAISRHVIRRYQPLLAEIGLTYPQYLAMIVLWEMGTASVNQLGARLQLDSGTLTPLLKRLAAQGLIRRDRDPNDERKVNLTLTEAGRALEAAAAPIPLHVFCATGASEAEVLALHAALRPLLDRIRNE